MDSFSICVFLDLFTAFETIDHFLHEVLSLLTSMHLLLWFSSFFMVVSPQYSLMALLLCSPLKDYGLSYPLWADASHIHICSSVPSTALMSSTSDYILDTLLGVP